MKSFRVGSAFGIPVRLDLTFLAVLPVFAYLIGVQLGELVPLLNDVPGFAVDADALTPSLRAAPRRRTARTRPPAPTRA